ncbi:MAG: aromatic-L-amino-acid decarboxylase [Gammaproteobacteria bacterium]|jgi:aromatic-L-amino-acid decarboxylase
MRPIATGANRLPKTSNLDRPLDDFQRDLAQCVDLIVERYRTLYDTNAHPGIEAETVREWFNEALPEAGLEMDEVLREVDDKVLAHPTMNIGTKMFAYVMSGGNQASVAADLIASALNKNAAKWHLAPSMTEIERRVIAWAAEFIGLEEHTGGAIVSSGSAANLTGLTVARNLFAEKFAVREKGLFGLAPLIVYGSNQTHNSVDKSVQLLGIGSDHYRKIPVLDDYTIDLDALHDEISKDKRDGLIPFCIVGNAGTVNTAAIDPLASLGEIARAHSLWFHVDGAYGGLAASLATKHDHYRGIALADSIALDYHKWLYQPYEVGCTLVRDWDTLKRTYHESAAYLDYGTGEERFDVSRHHFDLSRNTKAFNVWMSFKAYGAANFRAMIAKDIAMAQYLAEITDTASDFELVASAALGIVCFRFLGDRPATDVEINALNARLLEALEQDGRIVFTSTILHGKQVIRACIINHRIRRTDIDILIKVIREVGLQQLGTCRS